MMKHTFNLTDEHVFSIAEKYGEFHYGDAQGHKRLAFASDIVAAHERVRSAAPDLLEAAKLVLAWYEAEENHGETDFYQRIQMCRDSENAIRAAIAKATGDQS